MSLKGQNYRNSFGYTNGIEQIKFADGTVWNEAEIANQAIKGTSGADSIFGSIREEVINAGAGDDYILSQGYDTYKFGIGDGQDIIEAAAGVVSFKAGINQNDIIFTKDGKDLIATISTSGDAIRIKNWVEPKYYWNRINSFSFDNGTVLNANQVLTALNQGNDSEILFGSPNNDVIEGTDKNSVIYGGAGNDTLNGGLGADTLLGENGDDLLDGGLGADTLVGEAGDDVLNGGEGDDTLNGGIGNDTLDGGADNDLMRGGNGNDVYLIDSIDDAAIEKVEFHVADAMHLLVAIDNVIWTLDRSPGALATASSPEGVVQALLERHFATGLKFDRATTQRLARSLSPARPPPRSA